MQGDGANSPPPRLPPYPRRNKRFMSPKYGPIFPSVMSARIGASNRTCGAGDAGHDVRRIEISIPRN